MFVSFDLTLSGRVPLGTETDTLCVRTCARIIHTVTESTSLGYAGQASSLAVPTFIKA